MKLVFLDIDGVLNAFNSESERDFTPAGLSAQGIQWLSEINEKTGAEVVICSTWRKTHTVDWFQGIFESKGWRRAKIFGLTPSLPSLDKTKHNAFRGNEVEAFITLIEGMGIVIESHVIFDDGTDYHDHQPLILIDGQFGIQREHIDRAIKVLTTHE